MKESSKYLYSVVIPNPNETQLAIRLKRLRKGVLALVQTPAKIELDGSFLVTEEEIRQDYDWIWKNKFVEVISILEAIE